MRALPLLACGVLVSCQGGRLVLGADRSGAGDAGPSAALCDTDFTRFAGVEPVSFRKDVMPVFGLGCALEACHGGDTPRAGLYLGVRCAYDPATRGCVFPDAADSASGPAGPRPLTESIANAVRAGLFAPSVNAPEVRLVNASEPGASFLVDKLAGTQNDRGYDCSGPGLADLAGPCGGGMPFGTTTSLCVQGENGRQRFDAVAACVAQGAPNN